MMDLYSGLTMNVFSLLCQWMHSNCVFKSFLCVFCAWAAPPVGPAFGTVNTSVSEEGAVISWDYFGHHKNVYVEYIVENSKGSLYMTWTFAYRTPDSIIKNWVFPFPSAMQTLGKEDWKKELVNGSHWHMIKGLKPGTSYKVRVVARDPNDSTVHSTDEVLVAVPGEVACLSIDGCYSPYFCLFFCLFILLCLTPRL